VLQLEQHQTSQVTVGWSDNQAIMNGSHNLSGCTTSTQKEVQRLLFWGNWPPV
jgi:hypothetical protein